jgi:AraC-like DNA-binding protein
MKTTKKSFFPEAPTKETFPHFLGIEHESLFYKLRLETFHLYERVVHLQQNPREHSHGVFHAVLFLEADNEFKLDGKLCKSTRGTLVLIPPDIPHSFSPVAKGKTVYHELTFSYISDEKVLSLNFPSLLKKIYGNTVLNNKMLFQLEEIRLKEIESSYFLIAEALEHYNPTTPFEIYKQTGVLFEQLYQILSLNKTDASADNYNHKLANIRNKIASNLHRPFSLKALATEAGMSKEHFCREFKKVYKLPPLEMRINLRIDAAAKLLEYSDRPIKRIAEELGFSDVYHFSKVFRKLRKVPPGEFRRKSKLK